MTMSEITCGIRKSDTAEVRISRNCWKGRRVIDIRLWFLPKGGTEFIPSSKGVTIDASKLPELLDRLGELQ
jgi:hypothetical protein